MTNRYERLSNSELIEILQLRSLPKTGKRADYIARLLEYDRNLAHLESNRPSDLPKDVVPTYGPYLFYKGDTPGMHGTVTRIRTALANNHCDHELLDINAGWAYYMFWEKESKGRSLPALVKGGRIIGDLGQIRYWIDSDDPMERIAEAFEREGVDVGESLEYWNRRRPPL